MRASAVCAVMVFAGACHGAPPRPAELDTRNDACATCRMVVSNARFAGQLVAPGEDPLFFDDIGCLAQYLREHRSTPAKAIAYVADHRTGSWTPAATALFTRVPSLDTPMGSRVVAHASAASRDADQDARSGAMLEPAAFFSVPIPDGTR